MLLGLAEGIEISVDLLFGLFIEPAVVEICESIPRVLVLALLFQGGFSSNDSLSKNYCGCSAWKSLCQGSPPG